MSSNKADNIFKILKDGDYKPQVCAQANNIEEFSVGGKAILHTIINSPRPALTNQKFAATFYTALSYLLVSSR